MNKKWFYALGLFLAGIPSAKAQLVSGNLFLKGNYVEVGVQPNGSFGSNVGAPAGYHPHIFATSMCTSTASTSLLGYVADPAMDGWSTGTPAYNGDFFIPGTPLEGWAMSVDTLKSFAFSTTCSFVGSGRMTGSFTSYLTSGTQKIGIWEGVIDSITIRKEIVLDTTAVHYYTRVTLTNTSSVAKNNIYYFRTVDPDNSQTWPGGSFSTHNKVEYQLPNTRNATVVSARGHGAYVGSYMAMGTTDTNAKCMIYTGWPLSTGATLRNVFNGTETLMSTRYYTAGDTTNNDIAIGLAFRVMHLAPADSASDSVGYSRRRPANSYTFTYFHSFSNAATDSAIEQLTERIDTTHTTGLQTTTQEAAIQAYPNPNDAYVHITHLTVGDKIHFLDLLGRQLAATQTATATGFNTISVQNLPKGQYMLKITDAQGIIKTRIRLEKL